MRRAWWTRVWWLVFLVALVPAAVFLLIAYLVSGQMKIFFGAAAGALLALYLSTRDTPPSYVEKWRQGSEGERRTAKVLKTLQKDGWRVWNDIRRPTGANFDHVIVGPPGIFVLDTKNYFGEATVVDGELKVQQIDDPEDRWTCEGIASRMRGAGFELNQRIKLTAIDRIWVQPVVVLWQRFPQRIAEITGRSVVYVVHGDEVVRWLRSQPPLPQPSQERVIALSERAFRDQGSHG